LQVRLLRLHLLHLLCSCALFSFAAVIVALLHRRICCICRLLLSKSFCSIHSGLGKCLRRTCLLLRLLSKRIRSIPTHKISFSGVKMERFLPRIRLIVFIDAFGRQYYQVLSKS